MVTFFLPCGFTNLPVYYFCMCVCACAEAESLLTSHPPPSARSSPQWYRNRGAAGSRAAGAVGEGAAHRRPLRGPGQPGGSLEVLRSLFFRAGGGGGFNVRCIIRVIKVMTHNWYLGSFFRNLIITWIFYSGAYLSLFLFLSMG